MPDAKAERSRIRRRAEAGYSLLEILIAVAIMASLAALVGPRLLGQVDKSKVTTAKVQVKMLETALMTYYSEGGSLPGNTEELNVLVENIRNDPNWSGPYLAEDQIPLDPWGSPYQYNPPTEPNSIGEVFSLGADKQPGGTGLNADIS